MWRDAEEFLIKDQYLRSCVTKYGPCKIKKSPKKKYFSDLVESIVNQQLSGKAAATIFDRVCGLLVNLTPESVLTKTDEELRYCGLSNSKVKYVKDLGSKVVSGEVNLPRMNILPDEEIIMELTKVKGIGRWTAEMFLMFTLARPDAFPLDDLGIQKGMEKLLKKKLTKNQMEKFSLRWKPYRTAASWYLWRISEDKAISITY